MLREWICQMGDSWKSPTLIFNPEACHRVAPGCCSGRCFGLLRRCA